MRTKNKDKELNHRHFIGLRLTDVELDLLDQGAACLSISRSEYLRKLLRKEFYMDGLNCDPMSFDKECELTNAHFHKNKKYEASEYWRYEIAYPEIVSRIPFMFKALQISKRAFSSSVSLISSLSFRILFAIGISFFRCISGS